MTPEQTKDYLLKLDAQHPAQWTRGAWYDAVNPANGKPCKIRRSRSVVDNIPYLHITTPCIVVLRTPTGEELSREQGVRHYRANMRDFTVKEL